MTTIVWFRNDLRSSDHPALIHAAKQGRIIPVYLEDTRARKPGGAKKWWLHHALKALETDLNGLLLLKGDPREVLPKLAKDVEADLVCWNRDYEPHQVKTDDEVKQALKNVGVEVWTGRGSVLHEPWEIETGSGSPYKVFTPFWKAEKAKGFSDPLPRPDFQLSQQDMESAGGDNLEDWSYLPSQPNWPKGWEERWQPGEEGARDRLRTFVKGAADGYDKLRNRPDKEGTSMLSPHLHTGELSPRQVLKAIRHNADKGKIPEEHAESFLSELGWRDFSRHLLYYWPSLPEENWKSQFDQYPWREDENQLRAWQKGQTGYPMVDAGMRQLWQTGWMHNRIRMLVGSFLVKHLRMHWKHGETWFWDTLVDADLGNNSAGWQWVAGSGADASPYFRIFNPISQGPKYDPDGEYVRKWCPELAKLPTKHIHAPFEADEKTRKEAGVTLGETYPKPLVEHSEARQAALSGYDKVKSAA